MHAVSELAAWMHAVSELAACLFWQSLSRLFFFFFGRSLWLPRDTGRKRSRSREGHAITLDPLPLFSMDANLRRPDLFHGARLFMDQCGAQG